MYPASVPNPLLATAEDKAQAQSSATALMERSALLPASLRPMNIKVLQNGAVEIEFMTQQAATTFRNALISICENRECIRRKISCAPSAMFDSSPKNPTKLVVHMPATLAKLALGLEEFHKDVAAHSDNAVMAKTFIDTVENQEAQIGR